MGPKMSTMNSAIWWTFVHYILSCSKVKLWHVQARAEQWHLCWTLLNFIELLDNCLAPKLPVLSSSSQVTMASSVSKARTRGWANSWILAEFTGISFLNRRQTLQLFLGQDPCCRLTKIPLNCRLYTIKSCCIKDGVALQRTQKL